MNKKTERLLLVILFTVFGSLLFWAWVIWQGVQAEQLRQCGEDLQACRAAYCAQCLTDTDCERYCSQFEE